IAPVQPSRIDDNTAEWVAKQVTQENTLLPLLVLPRSLDCCLWSKYPLKHARHFFHPCGPRHSSLCCQRCLRRRFRHCPPVHCSGRCPCRLNARGISPGLCLPPRKPYCLLCPVVRCLQFLLADLSICISLCNLDRLLASLIRQQVPNVPAARHGEEPQLTVAGLALHEPQHSRGVIAGLPLGLGHGRSPCNRSSRSRRKPRQTSE